MVSTSRNLSETSLVVKPITKISLKIMFNLLPKLQLAAKIADTLPGVLSSAVEPLPFHKVEFSRRKAFLQVLQQHFVRQSFRIFGHKICIKSL